MGWMEHGGAIGSLISQESRESHGSGDQFGFDPWTLLNLLDQKTEYNRI